MNCKTLDSSTKSEWEKLLSKLPIGQQDIYFTPDYYILSEQNNEGRACCFTFEKNDDIALYPFLINPINKASDKNCYYDIQGAYGYNGIISSSSDRVFIAQFYKEFDKFCVDNNIVAEFVRFHPLLKNHNFSIRNMQVSFNRYTIHLDLGKGYEYIWEKAYDSRNRNMIRKASNSGLTVQINTKTNSLLRFHDMYQQTMKRVNAKPYYFLPLTYFVNLENNMSNNYFLVETLKNDRVVTTALILYNKSYAHYHLSARNLSISTSGAGNYVVDAAIKYAIDIGCRSFHLGGGTSVSNEDSLLKFKASFSKEKTKFFTGKKIHNKKVYDELCSQWENKHQLQKNTYKNYFLKYRLEP